MKILHIIHTYHPVLPLNFRYVVYTGAALSGLRVVCLPLDTNVAGSSLTEGDRFLRVKKSAAQLPSDRK